MVTEVKRLGAEAKEELDKHSFLKAFLIKFQKDNIGMLAGYLAWNILTSLVPIVVGLVAISSLFLRNASAQRTVVSHLSQALQGVFSPSEIQTLVTQSLQHQGLLWVIGLIGVLWGGSNVGGAFSTCFQAIYETQGRNFIKEKLLDAGMILVFTALMLIILAATAAGALLNRLVSSFPLPGATQFLIGTGISMLAAFLLFASIYLAFPNIHPKFKIGDVWPGALLATVLFEIITFIWPIYAGFAHFHRYGAVLFPILLLTAWIYFFAMIALLGAEASAVRAIRKAKSEGESVGPPPDEIVPQHDVLRETRPRTRSDREASAAGGQPGRTDTRRPSVEQDGRAQFTSSGQTGIGSDVEVRRDPAFWLLSAAPLVVGTLAGVFEIVREERAPSGILRAVFETLGIPVDSR